MNSAPDDPRGTLATALGHARLLLERAPRLAAEQAQEILKVVPDSAEARLIWAMALRRTGALDAALAALAPLLAQQGQSAAVQLEHGETLAALGHGPAALAALERAVRLDPASGPAWRALADQLTLAGDPAAASRAYQRHLTASVHDPQLLQAAAALNENRLAVAESLLRTHLNVHPTDVAAIRMLAELGTRLGQFQDAENLLSRCLELVPGFTAARYNLALVLHRQTKSEACLAQLDLLMQSDARNPSYLNLKAATLVRIGEYQAAIELYGAALEHYPQQPKGWMSYGHALKTVGRLTDSITAYEKSLALETGLGEAWWSLANLKTYRFSPAQIAEMKAQLSRDTLSDDDRLHLHFALGKALEDLGRYDEAFPHYAKGNAQRRDMLAYEADDVSETVDRLCTLFTEDFFHARQQGGHPAPDPIFILGMPRAGSTLLEQILSSHSQVEGTMELPDISAMVQQLRGAGASDRPGTLVEALQSLSCDDRRALGAEFLERTRVQRKTTRPFFIDKMPNNWLHAGFIHLILPNAKIIDARRHPLGCCFSAFKQHFARGQGFSYDLADLGRYYRDYVRLMAQLDAALPGRIHRVIYEHVVADTEGEIRRLLAYCGLPFQAACLRFHENERAVRTPSSEQVRQPIFTDAVEHWQHFETYLAPLRTALGNVLDSYPEVPPSFG